MAQRRKLTDKLRAEIKKNYKKLPKKGFTGEALVYFNRVRGAAKARKIKKDSVLEVNGVKIPKNTELYKLVEASAKLKGITVRHFVAAYSDEISVFRKEGRVVIQRETDYVISDVNALPKGKKVFQNGKPKTREEVVYNLTELKNTGIRISNIPAILFDEGRDYDNNMYLDFPEPSDYAYIFEETNYDTDEYDSLEDYHAHLFEEFLDDEYPDIIYFKS